MKICQRAKLAIIHLCQQAMQGRLPLGLTVRAEMSHPTAEHFAVPTRGTGIANIKQLSRNSA